MNDARSRDLDLVASRNENGTEADASKHCPPTQEFSHLSGMAVGARSVTSLRLTDTLSRLDGLAPSGIA